MKTVRVALVAILLYGCASQTTPPQEGTTSAEDSQTEQVAENSSATAERVAKTKRKYICTRERATGSHLTTTRCRTRKQLKQEREDARRIMDDSRVFDEQPSSASQ